MECEAIDCKDEAKHLFTLVIHSHIFAGLYEVNNKTQKFNLCKKHYEQALIDSKQR